MSEYIYMLEAIYVFADKCFNNPAIVKDFYLALLDECDEDLIDLEHFHLSCRGQQAALKTMKKHGLKVLDVYSKKEPKKYPKNERTDLMMRLIYNAAEISRLKGCGAAMIENHCKNLKHAFDGDDVKPEYFRDDKLGLHASEDKPRAYNLFPCRGTFNYFKRT